MARRENGVERLGWRELTAMGVGGMIGGGIFSVLGLAMAAAGPAAPLAFVFGGMLAGITGLSYVRLGLYYRSAGGSFTYLEKAFSSPRVGALAGWLLLVGYVGTMALYSHTFGVYGAALLGGGDHHPAMQHLLESVVLLAFLGVNLWGVRASGQTENFIVFVKVLILAGFAIIGLMTLDPTRLTPSVPVEMSSVLVAAALIFVAYEGFELIPNAINEMEDPRRDLGRSIFAAILITMAIYVAVAIVAVGHLTPEQVQRYGEYALAAAAEPVLGQAGFVLIGIAALFSTASAINATLFGTARLGHAMAREAVLPRAFLLRSRRNVPWVALVVITFVTLVFVNMADLGIIAAFASATFLLVFAAVNGAALRLRQRIGLCACWPLMGLVGALVAWGLLLESLWQQQPEALMWLLIFYLVAAGVELGFSQRRITRRHQGAER